MTWLAAVPALAAAAYYLLIVIAAIKWLWHSWRRQFKEAPARMPLPLSILKPVHGRDPRFYEAIFSHAAQKYPEFEILFGVSDPSDAVVPGAKVRLKNMGTAVAADTTTNEAGFYVFPVVIPGRYELTLDFAGKLTEQPRGLYLARYQANGATGQRARLCVETRDRRIGDAPA